MLTHSRLRSATYAWADPHTNMNSIADAEHPLEFMGTGAIACTDVVRVILAIIIHTCLLASVDQLELLFTNCDCILDMLDMCDMLGHRLITGVNNPHI